MSMGDATGWTLDTIAMCAVFGGLGIATLMDAIQSTQTRKAKLDAKRKAKNRQFAAEVGALWQDREAAIDMLSLRGMTKRAAKAYYARWEEVQKLKANGMGASTVAAWDDPLDDELPL